MPIDDEGQVLNFRVQEIAVRVDILSDIDADPPAIVGHVGDA